METDLFCDRISEVNIPLLPYNFSKARFSKPHCADTRGHQQQPCRKIIFPLPPSSMELKKEMEIYVLFMRYLRYYARGRIEVKILSAIRSVADCLYDDEDQIARALTEMGLRAPSGAFPAGIIQCCGRLFAEHGHNSGGGPSYSISASKESDDPLCQLYRHWQRFG